jgi:hypothetical protein
MWEPDALAAYTAICAGGGRLIKDPEEAERELDSTKTLPALNAAAKSCNVQELETEPAGRSKRRATTAPTVPLPHDALLL